MSTRRSAWFGSVALLLAVWGCTGSDDSTGKGQVDNSGGTSAGACEPGQQLCDAVCVDTTTSMDHCGSCGTACVAGQECQSGVCQCQAGRTLCDNECVELQSSASHCGSCTIDCGPTRVCSQGSCQAGGCEPGLSQCGQDCVQINTDSQHCGDCNVACRLDQICSAGTCTCPPGRMDCGGACVDTQTDPLHCGRCDNACTGGALCSAGSCGLSGTGGAGSGGVPSGGAPVDGGASGGAPLGGAPTGGTENGGTTTGGVQSPTGGTTTGGSATGGGSNIDVPFILGADISSTQESSDSYVDTDGQTKSIFELLKNHGFNYIRLKAFVDPSAPYGYASNANGCAGLSEPFGDRDHVVAYGKLAKEAGMGFLLDFHYSDVWADPGNQIIPEPWRNISSIQELATLMKEYTRDVISFAIDQGARPDMVQIGNEITPGMLMDVPGANTDCWGNNPDSAPIGGSTSNWDNLATLLKAGIEGVHEIDPEIEIMLHIENHEAASWWLESALSRGVEFDVFGLSCYEAFQGPPADWESTFTSLAAAHPDIDFAIAEYNPERTDANLIMKNLPNGQGRGTFFWEPTRSGDWGDAMFSWQGTNAVANAQDFTEFDALLPQLGL